MARAGADVVVNYVSNEEAFERMTLDQWNTVLGVNLTGQFLCAREAVREFKRRGVRPDISCAAGKITASADSDYVHGTSLFVDGGMTLPGFEAGG